MPQVVEGRYIDIDKLMSLLARLFPGQTVQVQVSLPSRCPAPGRPRGAVRG